MFLFQKIVKNLFHILPLLVLLTLFGCASSGGSSSGGGDQNSVTLDRIEVTSANPSIPKGTTLQFQATAVFSDLSKQDYTKNVTWSSSNSNTVFIIDAIYNQKGLATALSIGTATITAKVGNISKNVDVTVLPASLQSIDLTAPKSTIISGTTEQFTATGNYTDNTTKDLTTTVTWGSFDSSVAGISNTSGSKGLATAISAGSTTIMASFGGVPSNNIQLNVVDAHLTSISVTPVNNSIPQGASLQFIVTGTFDSNLTQDLSTQSSWTASDLSGTSVATINSSSGLATGTGLGTSTITATVTTADGTFSDSTTLTVNAIALNLISITPQTPSVANGSTQQFTVTGTYTDNSTVQFLPVSWSASDLSGTSVATINSSSGLATGTGVGTSTITATYVTWGTTFSDSTTLTVTETTLVSIAVTPNAPTIPNKMTQQFTATGTYSDGHTQILTSQVTWSSTSNTSTTVATIGTKTGLATAVSPGTTLITATLNTPATGPVSGTTTLTVSDVTLTSIAVTPMNPSIVNKGSQQFIATGTYSDNSSSDLTSTVTWNSSNTSVAVISNALGSNGLATAQTVTTASSTTIKATFGSASAGYVSGTTLLTVQSVNYPDLQITSLSGSFILTNFSISDLVINSGNVAADSFKNYFYFTQDPLSPYSATTSTYVGSRVLSGLRAGGVNAATKTFPTPSNMANGAYYLCGITDSENVIIEYNEGNNTRCAGPWTIGPDLQVSTISGSLSGSKIYVSDGEINSGNQAAPGFTVSFYLSGTTHPDPANDILISIGARTLSSGLTAGKLNFATSAYSIPASAPFGNYYLCAVTDSGTTVTETNETNNINCTANTYPVGPDLQVSSVGGIPIILSSGTSILVTDSEINTGDQAAGPFTVSFYLSGSATYDPLNLVKLGYRNITTGLAGGNALNSGSKTFSLPNGISKGTFYLFAVTDSGFAVQETNEGNNTTASLATITLP